MTFVLLVFQLTTSVLVPFIGFFGVFVCLQKRRVHFVSIKLKGNLQRVQLINECVNWFQNKYISGKNLVEIFNILIICLNCMFVRFLLGGFCQEFKCF